MVSDDFAKRVIDVRGEAGVEWLNRLPVIIAECERRWSLKVRPSFVPLSYNYVAPAARTDDTEVVLKLGVPHYELMSEMEALRIFGGHGTVKLLEADFDLGAMVLERLKPGVPLSTLTDDEQATSIVAQLIKHLWKPAPSNHLFPTVAKWAAGLKTLRDHFDGGTRPLPTWLVEKAEVLFSELIETMGERVLLHGDLHHDNILSAEREHWLAIDPKGVVGEAEYEVGAFLRNHLLLQPKPEEALRRRIDQFVEELEFDRERLVGWGLAQAVLSAWWGYEDHGRVSAHSITCAELLARL